MVKIGVLGATGDAGSDVFLEAQKRKHDVTALVRNQEKAQKMLGEDIAILERDAFDLTASDIEPFDVIVNAFATAPTQAEQHVELAQKLIQLAESIDEPPRLFFILGAGSLLDENDNRFIETIRQSPNAEKFIAVPEQQLKQLEFLKTIDSVNWVGVSPSAEFKKGEATNFELGRNHILQNETGESLTTSGTLAIAIIDEIENKSFSNERFTVLNL